MRFSKVNGMCVSSRKFTTGLYPLITVHCHQCGTGQCGGGRSPWLSTGKDWRSRWWATNFEWYKRNSTSAAGQPASGPATETWHRLQDDRWAKMSENRTRMASANLHSNWRSSLTDVGDLSLYPDSKVQEASMGPTWGRQHPCWPMLAVSILLSG